MAHLGVAHLASRQANGQARCAEGSSSIILPESIQVRLACPATALPFSCELMPKPSMIMIAKGLISRKPSVQRIY